MDWMNELGEDKILDMYGIAPGELYTKLKSAEWMFYSASELAKLLNNRVVANHMNKMKLRIRHGIKEELLKLVRIKGIGRVRARKLFRNNLKDVSDIKKIDISSLSYIIGKKTAVDLKKQVGEKVDEKDIKVKKNKRKGQISLRDF